MTVAAHPPLINRIRRGHWLVLDYLASGGYALLVLAMLVKYASGPGAVLAVLGGVAAFAAPIAMGRRWLPAALALLTAGLVVTLLVEPRAYLAAVVPMAFVLYRAATGPPRTAFVVLGVSLASAAAAALPNFAHLGATVVSGFGYLTVWTVGYAVGMHRRYTVELLRHQAQAAEAELADARREVSEERLRIARELHDVIAHGMSVITVQAAFGALILDEQPTQARSALEVIESTGRQTLAELRTMLGVLRTADPSDAPGNASITPSPSLTDLDRLITQTERAGVRVDLTLTASRPMSPGVELTAYRIVQEALTNVVRHAPTATARVSIDQHEDELTVEIVDDGAGATTAAEGLPGHGLIGMRERVIAYGGILHAAPSTDGGFCVQARIPLLAQRVHAGAMQVA